jgi:hypothetical protein
MSAVLGRVVTDYRTLVEICHARADELSLSRSEIDRLSGLPEGFSGKILGKVDRVKKREYKRMWPVSLELMLGVLGLKILVIEDEAAAMRTLARRTPVQANQQRFGESHWRNTPKLLPPPQQPAGPPSLTIVRNQQKRGVTKYG